MVPSGGARANAGRGPKDPLTAEELAFVLERRGNRRRAPHGSSWGVLAEEVNQRFRWRGALDPRTRAARGISPTWLKLKVAAAIKMQQQSNGPPSEAVQHLSLSPSYSGPRIGRDSPLGGSA